MLYNIFYLLWFLFIFVALSYTETYDTDFLEGRDPGQG